jgi:hypothetical protein
VIEIFGDMATRVPRSALLKDLHGLRRRLRRGLGRVVERRDVRDVRAWRLDRRLLDRLRTRWRETWWGRGGAHVAGLRRRDARVATGDPLLASRGGKRMHGEEQGDTQEKVREERRHDPPSTRMLEAWQIT